MISDFETERRHLQVTSDRFTALSNPNATTESLRDLVLGTFSSWSTHRSQLLG